MKIFNNCFAGYLPVFKITIRILNKFFKYFVPDKKFIAQNYRFLSKREFNGNRNIKSILDDSIYDSKF